jgi:hypothetical protein
METKFNFLNNSEVIKWCYIGITDLTLKNTTDSKKLKKYKELEDAWGNKIIQQEKNGQWTTLLCENLVMEALIKLGRKNVRKTQQMKSSVRNKKYSPDLECDEYVYEVKGRNWSTSGTAGEKILGVPLKYGEIPSLYKKPLQIVLVGYQEYEAREGFAFGDLLDSNNQTKELHDSLAFYKEHGIEYVAFTDILNKIGFPNNFSE